MRGTPCLYFKSLNRPFTILGVESTLFYLILGLCMPIPYSAHFRPMMDLVALSIFTTLLLVGIILTRSDPAIIHLYRRHIHFRKYYSAQPGLHAKSILIKPSVPFYQGKRGLV